MNVNKLEVNRLHVNKKLKRINQILMFENDKPICARVRKIEYFTK